MSIPYRMTATSITIVIKGVTHTLTEDSHANYSKIREAIKVKDFDSISELIDVAKAVVAFGAGKVKIVDGLVYVDDHQLNNTLTKRMLEQMEEGFDIEPMAKFLENLMQNPSKRAVDELYDWMEACDLPMTEDGYMLAYKRVRSNYTDIYTGKIDNSIGTKPKMARNMVDEDKARTCSAGLHFCSQSYLPNFSSYDADTDVVLIVKINPRDVVAIPADYGNAKGRCCEYEVIGEVDRANIKFYEKSVHTFATSTDEGFDEFGEQITDLDEFETYFTVNSMDEDGDESHEADFTTENAARKYIDELFEDDCSIFGAVIRNEVGDKVDDFENGEYESYEESSSSSSDEYTSYDVYADDAHIDEYESQTDAEERAHELIGTHTKVRVVDQDGDTVLVLDRVEHSSSEQFAISDEQSEVERNDNAHDEPETSPVDALATAIQGFVPFIKAVGDAMHVTKEAVDASYKTDFLVTKAQACAIMGVGPAHLEELLAEGEKIEEVVKGDKTLVRFKLK